MTCAKCGEGVSLWSRDLGSGLCPKCKEAEKQAEASRKQAEALEQATRERRSLARQAGITSVYPKGCPDCGGELAPVALFARQEYNLREGLGTDAAVGYYTDSTAYQGLVTGRLPVRGRIFASMCEGCRRVYFHGIPGAQ